MTLSVGVAVDGHEPLADVLARAEDLDAGDALDALWVADERFRRDPFVTLGALAARTTRLRLATCVTDAFIRHPALTGAGIATVADVSGGRAILGLGAGVSGFAALGIERERPALALREAIAFLRRLWSADAPFSFEGATLSFRHARLGFRPPDGRVPIHIAGRGPKILELAGELADGVLVATFLDGPLLDGSLARVEAGVARRADGLPPLRRISWAYVAIDDDASAARAAVSRGIAVALWGSRPILDELGVPLPASLRRLMDERAYSIEPETIDLAAPLIPDELVEACSIAGPPDVVARRLHELSARGFDEVAVWLFETADVPHGAMVDRLAGDVVPRLRTLETASGGG
jgi:5,10-methylenetetrahydromethanopterin reductase